MLMRERATYRLLATILFEYVTFQKENSFTVPIICGIIICIIIIIVILYRVSKKTEFYQIEHLQIFFENHKYFFPTGSRISKCSIWQNFFETPCIMFVGLPQRDQHDGN